MASARHDAPGSASLDRPPAHAARRRARLPHGSDGSPRATGRRELLPDPPAALADRWREVRSAPPPSAAPPPERASAPAAASAPDASAPDPRGLRERRTAHARFRPARRAPPRSRPSAAFALVAHAGPAGGRSAAPAHARAGYPM